MMAHGGDWRGYGGVGDYRNSNGNTETVMNEAHKIRDPLFDSPRADAVDTADTFDCVVVGGANQRARRGNLRNWTIYFL
ncbi:MAG: hypothetical protein DMG26_12820 [Acidobacteria bacterium]|nr:MAG: hypothetical protein DMG26_12820 [Acidobacteriota bacterium]